MAKVVEEDGSVNIGRPIVENTSAPVLLETDWVRKFSIMSKETINGIKTRPCSVLYTRLCEKYILGQKILITEWQTQGEYVMSILKQEG